MAFDPGARLDPSQVEARGRGMGGIGGGPIAVGGGGIGVVLLVVMLLLGVNPFDAGLVDTTGVEADQPAAQSLSECRTGADANARTDCRVVGFVDSVQKYWSEEFGRRGARYEPARTVLFSGYTQAACGSASSAMGPFYCPEDGKVYLDVTFFDELRQRFGAQGGPYAEGYVISHEYGHHVQDLLGLLSGGGSIATELQADCFAGVWMKHASETGYLKPPSDADLAQAIDAAAAVGDDRIQRQTEGRVTPERWTHGSSEQRMQWLRRGIDTGDMNACKTSR